MGVGTDAILELADKNYPQMYVTELEHYTRLGMSPLETITAAIDNWSVQVNPPCTLPTECDDADSCTTDTCDAGACAFTPVACDDGDGCTVDA